MLAALYILAIVGFPLTSLVPVMLRLDSQAATIPFRVVVLMLSLGVMIGWRVRRIRISFTPPILATLALWALLVARMVHGTLIDPVPGSLGMPISQVLMLSLGACFIPALAFLEVPSPATLDLARRWIEGLGAIAMLGVLYLGLSGVMEGVIFRRLGTAVLNPIAAGHLGVSVLIVTLCGLAGTTRVARGLRLVLIGLSVIVVVASVSRGPITAALVTVLLLAFTQRQRRRLGPARVLLRLGLLAVTAAGIAVAIDYLQDNEYVDVVARFAEALEDVSAQERIAMFRGAWQQFTEHPLLGSAFVELRFLTYPHNILVECLMATGLIGFTLLLANLGAALFASVRLVWASSPFTWVALIYVQYVLNGMFSGSLFLDGIFWAFGFAAMGLAGTLRLRPVASSA